MKQCVRCCESAVFSDVVVKYLYLAATLTTKKAEKLSILCAIVN